MSSLFDRMRSGAGKAAFEADKLRRVTGVQGELRGLRDEMQKVVAQVGRVAFELHQRGQAGPPELRAVCDQAAAVLAQINAKEAEIERIRAEQFVDPGLAVYDPSALLCPAGHGPLPGGARFCQYCGQAGVAPAPPPPAGPPCATCGTPLEAGASFCANCGQPVGLPPPPPEPPRRPDPTQPETVRLGGAPPTPAPAPTPPPAKVCPSCGAPADDPGLRYCATCGYPFKPTEEPKESP